MAIKIWCILLLSLIAVKISPAQQKNLKFDMKYQILTNDFLVVSDSLDHKIGSASGSGSASMKDGTTAGVKVFFIYDYTSGNGYFTEYYVLTFPDSSKMTIQAQGKSMGSVKGEDPLFTADVTVTDGTGIYAGVQGSGNMTGNRRDELKQGTIVKLSFTIKLK
jgi:hypothetical protein